MTFQKLIEKFTDMGKLSDTDLKKGQSLTDEEFNEVEGTAFFDAISKIRDNDISKLNKGLPYKGLDTLTVYKRPEYKNMRCFLGPNNSSGYALHDKHELVSVFSSQGSSGNAIMTSAVKNGATHLDCFAFRDKSDNISGPLYSLYSKHGFKIDKSMNSGTPGEAYAIVKGVSDFVDDNEVAHPEDERVVIFMKR
jgi:hypothetical protein